MKKFRFPAIVILSVLVVSLLVTSCGNNVSDVSSVAESVPEAESSAEQKELVPGLEKRDLGGFTLRILSCLENEPFNKAQLAPEELTDERVNDAVYNRNRLLEKEYNCFIEAEFTDGFEKYVSKIDNDILAGVGDYNALTTGVQTLAMLAMRHDLYDLNSISGSNLRLDSDWWDQSANNSMTLCGKLFFATGDVVVTDKENTHCLFFNKDMISVKGLESPYQLVYSGKWTVDKMYELCKQAAVDGGDGLMNMSGEDTWGFVGAAFDTYKLIIGCNCPHIELDKDGIPVIAMAEERNINAFDKVYTVMTDKSCVAWLEQYYRWDDYDNNWRVKQHFYDGQALFFSESISNVNGEKMLNAAFNYGVVPTPKLDETQDYYVDAVDPYRFGAVSIPKTVSVDTDKVTFLLEAMAYLNKQSVTTEYYEVTLKEKRFRDDDAAKMLDEIFAHRVVDLSVIYNWNDCIHYYNQLLYGNNHSVSSFMQANGPAMEAAMQETIADLLDLKD